MEAKKGTSFGHCGMDGIRLQSERESGATGRKETDLSGRRGVMRPETEQDGGGMEVGWG
jgi:hypothetical protein